MGQITCMTQEVSSLTELSPQLLFWSVNLPILNTLELTSKYTTECSRIHGSQAHDNRCITGPTSNQRENCQTSLHNISPLWGQTSSPDCATQSPAIKKTSGRVNLTMVSALQPLLVKETSNSCSLKTISRLESWQRLVNRT